MKLMPQGDYVAWDCDWCDSHNRIPWTRLDAGKVVCAVCYSKFFLPSATAVGNSIAISVTR